MKKNNYRLVPGTINYWGDILGNIEEQKDLIEYISTHSGGGTEAVWGSISGNISNQSDLMETLSSYALLSDIPSLEGYATESWVSAQGYLTSETIPSDIATQSWVESQGYLTSVPSGYATESWVESQGYLTDHQSLEGYATESWVSNQGYLTSVPSGYATESWVNDTLSSYALSTDIPSLDGYATESWVSSQGYLTEHQSLDGYATESWVESQDYASKDDPDFEPLVNKEEGYLKYKEFLKGNQVQWVNEGGYFPYICVFNLNDSIYLFNWGDWSYYIFNETTYSFDYVANLTGDLPGGPGYKIANPWVDTLGRCYLGNQYKLDLQTGVVTYWEMGGDYQINTNQSGKNNILTVDGVTYMISSNNNTAYIFNTTTQLFDSSLPCNNIPYSTFYNSVLDYNGKILYSYGSDMYELKVYEDRLDWEYVDNPYYPMTWEYNGANYSTNSGYVHPINDTLGVLGYPGNSILFILENGSWVPTDFNPTAESYVNKNVGAYKGDLWFGYSYGNGSDSVNLLIWNFGDTKEFYGWSEVDVPTKVSELVNDAGYATNSDLTSLANRVTDLETAVGQAETITNEILG